MARFDHLKGVFGLLPTPYNEDYTIRTADLRSAATFCCRSGQHGIVWPVMVGEFYYLGEQERISHLDVVLEEVNGRLPVVFGCSGVSVPQVLQFARAAQQAGADAIIAMAPTGTNPAVAIDMYRRLGDAYDGPIILQNVSTYTFLTNEQIATLLEEVPQIEYVKEERSPAARHIGELHRAVGSRIKTIFGGAAGKFMPEELSQGADGCMPACEVADLLAKVMRLWWAGDEEGARDLHRRLLPLIMRETHPFMRYMLKRRGVFTSTLERAPSAFAEFSAGEKRELTTLLRAVEGDIESYPFGPE